MVLSGLAVWGRIGPLSISYSPPRRLFTEQIPVYGLFVGWTHDQFDVFRPDRTMIVQGKVIEKYIRREREWVWYECVFKDAQTGRDVCRTTRGHVLYFQPRGTPQQVLEEVAATARPPDPYFPPTLEPKKSLLRDPGAGIFSSRGRSLQIGTALTPISMQLTRQAVTNLLRGLSGHDESQGVPTAAANGPHAVTLIHRMMVHHFGEGYVQRGKFNLRFVQIIDRNDFITGKAVVTGHRLEEGMNRIECDVWIEKHTGEKAVVGSASALVPIGD